MSIDAELILEGVLDDTQLARLREAAQNCRISRALNVPVSLRLTLTSPPVTPASGSSASTS